MIKETEVRQWLLLLLRHDISLDEFQNWLDEHSWNMHLDSPRTSQNLVWAIELALAEYSNGHLNTEELRQKLFEASRQIEVNVQVGANFAISPLRAEITTGTSSGPPQRVELRLPEPA